MASWEWYFWFADSHGSCLVLSTWVCTWGNMIFSWTCFLKGHILCVKSYGVFFYRLAEGLSTLGLLDMMRIHHSIFKTAFCASERPLKATDLISLFQVELSPPGSNWWQHETKVEGFWRDFLLDIEGKLMIDLLSNSILLLWILHNPAYHTCY